jgi:hypothetical protein
MTRPRQSEFYLGGLVKRIGVILKKSEFRWLSSASGLVPHLIATFYLSACGFIAHVYAALT